MQTDNGDKNGNGSDSESDLEDDRLDLATQALDEVTALVSEIRARRAEKLAARAAAAEAANGANGRGGKKALGCCRQRVANSTLRRYVLTINVDPQDADGAVNTLTLVAALVLTIPFIILIGFGQEYWDHISEVVGACDTTNVTAEKMFLSVFRALNATIYAR